MNLSIKESTPEIEIGPSKHLKISLLAGSIILHLKKTDGIELTYSLNNVGEQFNEGVEQFRSYRILALSDSSFDVLLS